TALVLVPLGQFGSIWFTLIAGLAVLLLLYIAKWYKQQLIAIENDRSKNKHITQKKAPKKALRNAIIVLIFIVFARSWYHNAIGNFYIFYAIAQYDLSIAKGQIYIFTFLFMGAIGTFLGGPLADRFGKRTMIILSFVIPAPFALLLPYVNSSISLILFAIIVLDLMYSFSFVVMYAHILIPGK